MTAPANLLEWIHRFRRAHRLATLDAMANAARQTHPEQWPTIEQAAEHREAEISLGCLLPIEG